MTCPKCKGKVKVVDTCNDNESNEIYRRRECLICKHNFITGEFEIDLDETVKSIFRKNRRGLGYQGGLPKETPWKGEEVPTYEDLK